MMKNLLQQLVALEKTLTEMDHGDVVFSLDEARQIARTVGRVNDLTRFVCDSIRGIDQIDRGEFVDIDDVITEMECVIGKIERDDDDD